MYKRHTHLAFTLVELAIVLVIIGLVIGGVLLGKDMIYESQVRAVLSDIDRYKTAAHTFKLKYNCLPGDCPNAYDYFSPACGTNSTSTGGCNGDGDGKVNFNGGSGQMGTPNEMYKFWQLLNLAGLSAASVTGAAAGGNPVVRVGLNIPASSFDGAGYSVQCRATEGNTIFFGKNNSTSDVTGYVALGAVFSPRQALAIDLKYDDGKPALGRISGANGGFPSYTCVSGGSYTASDNIECILHFYRLF